MRILVTGAGGYIGRHLVPKLRDEGHEVVELHRASNDGALKWDPLSPNAEWRRFIDLAQCSGKTLLRDLPEAIDTVVHLAGRVDINLLPNPKGAHLPPIPGPCDVGALYRDNVLATANVLDYCLKAGVKHLIFASTQAVYGMGYTDEGAYVIQPLEHYAASKRVAEMLLETGRQQGLKVTILRLPGVFGGDRREGVVYRMCRDALRRGVVKATGLCPLPINTMHLEDVVDAVVSALSVSQMHGVTTDVTGPEPCSLTLLAQEIASLVPGCIVAKNGIQQPVLQREVSKWLNWHPKPRKERLQQVLEEIRKEMSCGER